MIKNLRVILFAENTPVKLRLATKLRSMVDDLVHVESSVEGLKAVTAGQFDAAIISEDIDDYYSSGDIIRILLESNTIQTILTITEREDTPEHLRDDDLEPRIQSIHISEAENCCQRILAGLEEAAQQIERKRAIQTKRASLTDTPLFDSVPTGLYRINPDGDFLDMNETLVELFRAPNREALLADNYFMMFKETEDKQTWNDIMHRDGMIRGLVVEIEQYDGSMIWIRDNARPVYNESGVITFYDGSLENVTLQKQHEDKLTFLATHDILTGLPNRNFFNDQAALTISQARYNGDILAFLIFDLDYFNRINETFGNKTGDKILQLIAERTRIQLRKSDLISRLSGDKFIALLSSIRTRRDALSVAKKISSIFDEPFRIEDREISITASSGIAFYPEHGEEVSTLVKRAEIAVYAVKDRDRGGYMIFSDSLHYS